MITSNLYQRIIRKEGQKAAKLRIISGYVSSGFLYRVSQDFPNLEIEVFIGMAKEGISYQNHNNFKVLSEDKLISVYYQVKGIPTHIKLYEFSSNNEINTYVGSANFSENGFIKQRELLTKINTNKNDKLFEQIAQLSLKCTDFNVLSNIPLFEDDREKELTSQLTRNADVLSLSRNEKGDGSEVPSQSKKSTGKSYSESKRDNKSNQLDEDTMTFFHQKHLAILRGQKDLDYYDTFYVNIMGISVSKWQNTGINAIFQGKQSVLLENQGLPFYKVFPEDNIFEIYADNSKVYQARLTGINKNELSLIDEEFYDYVREHMDITDHRPITRADIEKNNLSTVKFERIDKTTYLMEM
ncbi:phospholipase D family protein [Aerococcus urinaeequi]|uniref:Restriction endonuclease type II NgoFVII N-terminal domain-containing protein n=1 Tax=Aerococcus urinaeequi TaxID=51665 RepID=A0AAC8X099_9LACT|nr:phospholipase D family protein [Aerococcus urinaeequi]AMB97390.1 hypothetical protein AWM74_03640 [Aerococcus urinaeequi]